MPLFTRPWQISGIAGLLFVVLSFVASAMNVQPPAYNQDEAVFAAWFVEHGERFRVGHLTAGLAFLLFYFPFLAGLCERLREAEGTPAIWSRVAWAGAIMSPAAGTVSGSLIVGVALLGGTVSPGASAFAAAGSFYAYVVAGAYGGLVMIGAAAVILRTGVLWRWLGWTGGLVGLAAIIGSAAVVENDPTGLFASINALAWLAYFLWMAAAAIALIRTRGHLRNPCLAKRRGTQPFDLTLGNRVSLPLGRRALRCAQRSVGPAAIFFHLGGAGIPPRAERHHQRGPQAGK